MSTPTHSTAGGRTDFVVARTARKNPDINGRTLYMSTIGLWTLDIDHARRFTEKEAFRHVTMSNDFRVERVGFAGRNVSDGGIYAAVSQTSMTPQERADLDSYLDKALDAPESAAIAKTGGAA